MLLFLFTVALTVWNSVYSKLMFTLFTQVRYEHFEHFARIVNNARSKKERSLFRNLVFNFARCFSNEAATIYVMGSQIDQDTLTERAVGVFIMTCLAQYFLPRSVLDKASSKWRYVMVFYWTSFGILWLNDVRTAEIFS
jgi:hypothetical protein